MKADSRQGPSAVVLLTGVLIAFVAFSVLIIVMGNLPTAPAFTHVSTGTLNEWRQLKASETEQLNSYGWVDEQAGYVHIPIDRAMDLVLQQGLPARQPGVEAQTNN